VLALARIEIQDQVIARPAEHVLIDQIIEQPLVDDQAVGDVAALAIAQGPASDLVHRVHVGQTNAVGTLGIGVQDHQALVLRWRHEARPLHHVLT
jgi:hypothetical protein